MKITDELLAAYVDGNVTKEERDQVRKYLAENPSELEAVMLMTDENFDLMSDDGTDNGNEIPWITPFPDSPSKPTLPDDSIVAASVAGACVPTSPLGNRIAAMVGGMVGALGGGMVGALGGGMVGTLGGGMLGAPAAGIGKSIFKKQIPSCDTALEMTSAKIDIEERPLSPVFYDIDTASGKDSGDGAQPSSDFMNSMDNLLDELDRMDKI